MNGTNGLQAPQVYAPTMMFKGARQYIHSTDLYPELITGAAACGWRVDGAIDIRFKRLLATQPEFQFAGSVGGAESATASVEFTLGVKGDTVVGRIVGTDRPVTARKTYDERGIWDLAKISDRSIRLIGDSGYAPIEVATALTLLLHNTVLPVTIPGRRWLLARLSLNQPLEPADAIDVSVEIQHVIGHSMTSSTLTTQRGALGQILFMVGQPSLSR